MKRSKVLLVVRWLQKPVHSYRFILLCDNFVFHVFPPQSMNYHIAPILFWYCYFPCTFCLLPFILLTILQSDGAHSVVAVILSEVRFVIQQKCQRIIVNRVFIITSIYFVFLSILNWIRGTTVDNLKQLCYTVICLYECVVDSFSSAIIYSCCI